MTHPTDSWTPEGWPAHFAEWERHHRVALDMNGGKRDTAIALMAIWKKLWAKPVKENGRIISYRGLRPSFEELESASEWMMFAAPETRWKCMFRVLSLHIEGARERRRKRDDLVALHEERERDAARIAEAKANGTYKDPRMFAIQLAERMSKGASG